MVVGFHLNRQLHSSQRPDTGSIEGVEGGSFLVDTIKNAFFFSNVLKKEVYSLFIVHQNPADHGVKDFHLDDDGIF